MTVETKKKLRYTVRPHDAANILAVVDVFRSFGPVNLSRSFRPASVPLPVQA